MVVPKREILFIKRHLSKKKHSNGSFAPSWCEEMINFWWISMNLETYDIFIYHNLTSGRRSIEHPVYSMKLRFTSFKLVFGKNGKTLLLQIKFFATAQEHANRTGKKKTKIHSVFMHVQNHRNRLDKFRHHGIYINAICISYIHITYIVTPVLCTCSFVRMNFWIYEAFRCINRHSLFALCRLFYLSTLIVYFNRITYVCNYNLPSHWLNE